MGKIARNLLLATSLFGLLLCILNASGAELFCATQGCGIYSGYKLFGLSFYVYGAVGFAFITLLALLYPRGRSPQLLFTFLLLFLLFDGLFLVYQYLLWPCSSCSVVALLIGLMVAIALFGTEIPAKGVLFLVSLVWSVFFFYVGLAAVKEVAFSPWPLVGKVDAAVKVYFSPECPSCKETVGKILDDAAVAESAAFFPIAKGDADLRRLAILLNKTENQPKVADLRELFREPSAEIVVEPSLELRLHLFRNKMALAGMRATTVPQVIGPRVLEVKPPAQVDFGNLLDGFTDPNSAVPLEDNGCSAFSTQENCD